MAVLVLPLASGLAQRPAPSAEARVQDLEGQVEALENRIKKLEAQNIRLKDKSVRTLALYTRADRELEALRRENSALRAARGEYAKLKKTQADLEDALKELKRLTGKGQVIPLSGSGGSFKWFIAGAGVFLLGIIVGRLSRGTKRYRSSLDI
jgi:SH3 domain protein